MEWLVTAAASGRTVRDVARNELLLSYSALQGAKWEDRILVNGLPVRVSAVLREGDLLTIEEAKKPPAYLPSPYQLPLHIPYRDQYLLVVDKSAPLAVQCSARQPHNTLENALYSCMGCPDDFVFRPVNRLDKGTSGLMLVALDAHTQQLMQRQLHSPDFQRQYLAVTEGCPSPAEGTIDLPIAKADGATVRREVSPDGKKSITHYRTLEQHGSLALLSLCLETGRTHQIRVHLSAMGCPVCGDFLYGTEREDLAGRFALHSAELCFRHPYTGSMIRLSSPLPEQLSSVLRCGC